MNTTTNQVAISVITSTIAFMALLCVVSVCVLSYKAIQIPPELNTLTGGLAGALTAMLVKTSPTETMKQPPHPTNGDTVIPVEVTNTPVNPVPTTEEPKP